MHKVSNSTACSIETHIIQHMPANLSGELVWHGLSTLSDNLKLFSQLEQMN